MRNIVRGVAFMVCCLAVAGPAWAGEITAKYVEQDLSRPDPLARYWYDVPATEVSLMGQPMVVPRPKVTLTSGVRVQAIHDGKWLSLRLQWKDKGRDEAGRLGQFSDGAAIQFPVRPGSAPPPVMMGAKGDPVHIFHWRAQYQRDREKGKPTMRDLYPNMSVDAYPMDFADPGSLGKSTDQAKEQFSPGAAVGNPQSFPKTGVDEIVAEGFSTSSVQEGHGSLAEGVWANDEWVLVIARRLVIEGGSVLAPADRSFLGFAIWQGGESEVGSRKSVTMTWTPLVLEPVDGIAR
jgi:hypothetical protein